MRHLRAGLHGVDVKLEDLAHVAPQNSDPIDFFRWRLEIRVECVPHLLAATLTVRACHRQLGFAEGGDYVK